MSHFTVWVGTDTAPYYALIEAADSVTASERAMDLNPCAHTAQVVREIDRAEFERLTQVQA